jgi:hypothetical protein
VQSGPAGGAGGDALAGPGCAGGRGFAEATALANGAVCADKAGARPGGGSGRMTSSWVRLPVFQTRKDIVPAGTTHGLAVMRIVPIQPPAVLARPPG